MRTSTSARDANALLQRKREKEKESKESQVPIRWFLNDCLSTTEREEKDESGLKENSRLLSQSVEYRKEVRCACMRWWMHAEKKVHTVDCRTPHSAFLSRARPIVGEVEAFPLRTYRRKWRDADIDMCHTVCASVLLEVSGLSGGRGGRAEASPGVQERLTGEGVECHADVVQLKLRQELENPGLQLKEKATVSRRRRRKERGKKEEETTKKRL